MSHLEQRSPSLSPTPNPLPTPPSESPAERFKMPEIKKITLRTATSRPFPRRSSTVASNKVEVEDSKEERMMVLEEDASPEKYMHHFDNLSHPSLDVKGPFPGQHQIKVHSSGPIPTWEYELPSHLWPKLKDTAKMLDPTLRIRWGRENGYVQFTNICKALDPNIKVNDFLRGYEAQVSRVRGGQIEVQGSWIPYDVARKVCVEKCYKIRHYLEPLFGPDFVKECRPPPAETTNAEKPRPGRKPKSAKQKQIEKRRAEEMEEDVDSDDEVSLPPPKRRDIAPAAPITITPPPFPSDLTLDHYGPKMTPDEICTLLATGRALQGLRFQAGDNVSWPAPGDKRLGGEFWYLNRHYHWDGNNRIIIIRKRVNNTQRQTSPPPTTILPSFKEFVQPPSSAGYERLPCTPSPHQSPFQQSPFQASYDWQPRNYLTPPGSLRESFSISRDRQDSVFTTDECHTPVREHYGGSLFSTPQPEGR